MKKGPTRPTLREVERALGEPATAWVARCYEIACAIVERKLVDGVAVYGHWTGPIAPRSRFADKAGAGFCQHGWIILPDGRVLDPTRWAFEVVRPYLYLGPSEHYYEGGNRLRHARMPEAMPARTESRTYELSARVLREPRALAYVRGFLPAGERTTRIGLDQLFWLANRDPRTLGGHAASIFEWLKRIGHGSLIPIDNLRMVEEGRVAPVPWRAGVGSRP